MPTYVFACEACGHEFSVETSWSKKGEVRCPGCNGDSLKELFGRYTLNVVGGDSGGASQAPCDSGCG